MPFQMPTEFQKEIAPSTQKVYKSKLNALAKRGYDTVEKIQTEQKKVIEAIKEITGDGNDELSRLTRRVILSAIFWSTPLPKSNQYHRYWQHTTPLTVVGTQVKWQKRKDYTE
jgi:hypothetical protein